RRRHTRWPRDWSSDVCSSDLEPRGPRQPTTSWRKLPTSEWTIPWIWPVGPELALWRADRHHVRDDRLRHAVGLVPHHVNVGVGRSEERRVGKQCGSLRGGCWE